MNFNKAGHEKEKAKVTRMLR